MTQYKCAASLLLYCVVTAHVLNAQTTSPGSKPQSDVLILTDGEKIIGQLQSASDSSVVFKSELLGELTIDWSKIQEIQSPQTFAAVPKGVKLRSREDAAKVPQGTVSVADQKLQLHTSTQSSPQSIPVGDLGALVNRSDFEKGFQNPGFFHGWKGGATGGISITEATQKSQTYTAALNFVRAVPSENWLDLRNRTIFGLTEAYGKISEPGSSPVKTSLFHFDAEQDRYLNPRLFVFGQAVLDHSFSQGLKLQQTYGGGVGFVVFKSLNREFDVKASADYIDQRFETPGLDQKLFGSIFGETYIQKFMHGIVLNEQAGITPAWNNTSAYSAFASAGLTFPVYHRFGLTLGALDNFLNNPPPGFKKNSFQFTAGATYSFQ
ncbi:MAG: DUF481 domain-containing protein [Bryobacteraceae bacterium]